MTSSPPSPARAWFTCSPATPTPPGPGARCAWRRASSRLAEVCSPEQLDGPGTSRPGRSSTACPSLRLAERLQQHPARRAPRRRRARRCRALGAGSSPRPRRRRFSAPARSRLRAPSSPPAHRASRPRIPRGSRGSGAEGSAATLARRRARARGARPWSRAPPARRVLQPAGRPEQLGRLGHRPADVLGELPVIEFHQVRFASSALSSRGEERSTSVRHPPALASAARSR